MHVRISSDLAKKRSREKRVLTGSGQVKGFSAIGDGKSGKDDKCFQYSPGNNMVVAERSVIIHITTPLDKL